MQTRCYGCMKTKYSSPICEHCGFDERKQNANHQLPLGTVLRGQYLIGKVLGQGGFGITYLGWDLSLDMPVAVKEFFPRGYVGRDTTFSINVFSSVQEHDPSFHSNKARFLREAQTLAKLENVPQVVRIRSFFEENNTAYIVMEYIQGQNLRDYILSQGGTIPAQRLLPLLRPTLEALMKVHEAGLVHRDISPDNIMLLPDGSTKLLDFGAVRFVSNAGVDKALTHSTQAILKHGFAPIEQYQSKGSLGPWTDVYAMCGTIYYCLTGKVPPEAGDRIIEGESLSWDAIPGLTEKQRRALDLGTAVLPKGRLSSVKELYNQLYDDAEELERLKRKQQEERERKERERKERERKEQERLAMELLAQEKTQLEKDPFPPDYYTAEVSRNGDNQFKNFGKPDGTVQLKGIDNIPPFRETPPPPPPPPPPQKKKWWIPAAAAVLALVGCVGMLFGGNKKDNTSGGLVSIPETVAVPGENPQDNHTPVEISLWTYPIGGWGNEATVNHLIDDFQSVYPHITVSVKYLNYADGDDQINTAVAADMAPDLVMEGPERLVANWGKDGLMVNIADLYDDTDKSEIYPTILDACFADETTAYEYPLVMTAHCMAINKTVFEAAGAMQYINEDTHTWKSVADFEAAIAAVYKHTRSPVGAVYCVGQGGDQGTRALVTNLGGGSFTNAEHTAYTWDSQENIAALKALYDNPAIAFDSGIAGGDEIALFYNGKLNVAFCWNIAQQLNPNSASTGAERTAKGDEIMFMAFPADGDPRLMGNNWGFGIFDNGDAARINAAKTFIRYFCDSAATADAVRAANYFAVRNSAGGADLSNIWADNAIMAEYSMLMPMLGDYCQVTPGWTNARICWWNMLQDVGTSNGSVDDISAIVEQYVNEANSKIS